MSTPLPKITVVTPSFNQGQFIEQTIVSVLDQRYPNLEYIVMDGGSTDGTVDILRKYERHIDFWSSAPDGGQADAINRGFARGAGELLAWLNSDDVYEPGAVAQAAEVLSGQPDIDVISGRCRLWYGDGRDLLTEASPLRAFEDFLDIKSNWLNGRLIIQPEAFFRRRAFEKAGGLRETMHYCFDVCLWIDMAKAGCKFASIDRHWANLRMHDWQKTRDLSEGTMELARVVWTELRQNWTRLENPFAIADGLFATLEEQVCKQRNMSANLRDSTSYRLGRLATKWKFW